MIAMAIFVATLAFPPVASAEGGSGSRQTRVTHIDLCLDTVGEYSITWTVHNRYPAKRMRVLSVSRPGDRYRNNWAETLPGDTTGTLTQVVAVRWTWISGGHRYHMRGRGSDSVTLNGDCASPSPTCTAGYDPCLVYHSGADYDCYGGSGDGPYYTEPGVVYTVTGSDPYALDADNDGTGCE